MAPISSGDSEFGRDEELEEIQTLLEDFKDDLENETEEMNGHQ